jgi:hypothetical protein
MPYKDKQRKSAFNKAYRIKHRDKLLEYTKEWQKKNWGYWLKYQMKHKDKIKSKNLRQYGITLEAYETLLETQQNLCAICRKPEIQPTKHGDGTRELSVDHDHRTGRVRGLLCNRCNIRLGMVDDDLELLRKMIDYLTH